MMRRIGLALIIALSTCAAAGPALAQEIEQANADRSALPQGAPPASDWESRWSGGPGDGGLRLLSPRAVTGSLIRQGYRAVEIKRVRGSSYVAEADAPDGSRVVLVVDGRTSEIAGQRVIGWPRGNRNWDDAGWRRPSPLSGPRW